MNFNSNNIVTGMRKYYERIVLGLLVLFFFYLVLSLTRSPGVNSSDPWHSGNISQVKSRSQQKIREKQKQREQELEKFLSKIEPVSLAFYRVLSDRNPFVKGEFRIKQLEPLATETTETSLMPRYICDGTIFIDGQWQCWIKEMTSKKNYFVKQGDVVEGFGEIRLVDKGKVVVYDEEQGREMILLLGGTK